jgi:hypothetical protein
MEEIILLFLLEVSLRRFFVLRAQKYLLALGRNGTKNAKKSFLHDFGNTLATI